MAFKALEWKMHKLGLHPSDVAHRCKLLVTKVQVENLQSKYKHVNITGDLHLMGCKEKFLGIWSNYSRPNTASFHLSCINFLYTQMLFLIYFQGLARTTNQCSRNNLMSQEITTLNLFSSFSEKLLNTGALILTSTFRV